LFGEPFGLPPLRPFSALVRFFSSLSASGLRPFGEPRFSPLSERGALFFVPLCRPAKRGAIPSATAWAISSLISSPESSASQCGHLIGINKPTFVYGKIELTARAVNP
jgi:hypothetical protein